MMVTPTTKMDVHLCVRKKVDGTVKASKGKSQFVALLRISVGIKYTSSGMANAVMMEIR